MLFDAAEPHRMIHGASAVGERCRQRSQITHSQGVTLRRSAKVATGMFAVRVISATCGHSHQPESHET
jgi:hypothetical protein